MSTRFVADVWAVRDGLPQGSVLGISEDDDGFLWLATFGGLVRFDGRGFLRIDTPAAGFSDHRFVDVVADGPYVIVSTQYGGLYRVHRKTRVASPIAISPTGATARDLVLTPAGHVLAAVDRRVVRVLEERTEDIAQLDANVFGLASDPRGRIFASTDEAILCVDEGCPVPPLRGALLRLLGPVGETLVASDGTGAWRLVGDRWERWQDRPYRALAVDDAGVAWGADEDGLFRLRDGLPTERVMLPERRSVGARQDQGLLPRAMRVTSTGQLWVGTDDRGLFGITDRRVTQIAERAGLTGPSVLAALPLSSGAVLVGGYCGGLQRVSVEEGGDGVAERLEAFGADACVTPLLEREDGAVIVAADGGLFSLRDDEATLILPLGLEPYANATALVLEQGDTYLVGAEHGGVLRVALGEAPTVVRRFTKRDGLPDERITSLVRANSGEVLVGTQGGVAVLAGDEVRTALNDRLGRAAQVRDTLVLDDGTVLGATYGEGLFVATSRSADEAAPPPARWLGTSEGLCGVMLARLLKDPRYPDVIFLNSNSGVSWLTVDELKAAARDPRRKVRCRRIESGEGNGGAQPAGGFLPDGRLVVPTTEGLALITPSDVLEAMPAPPAVTIIEHASVDGRSLTLDEPNVIPPGRRDLTLELASPSFDAPGPPQFEVTLLGDGEVKVDVAGDTRRYIGLDPGEYQLRVRRRYGDGRAGPAEQLAFTLAPAFLERTAVRVGAPLGLFLAIALALRSWIRALRGRARLLEQELTERRRSEQARKERDRLYEAAFRRSPVPLLVFDAGGRLVDRNPGADALVHPQGGEADGFTFVVEQDRPLFAESLATCRPAEVRFVDDHGGARVVAITPAAFTLRDKPHTLVGVIDVTAAREAESQRQALLERTAAAQRLEGLGRLAAGIAHDFNNVLAAVSLQAQLLQLESDDGHVLESVAEMTTALERGRKLTERFLVFGGGPVKDAAHLRLDNAVAASEAMLARLMPPSVRLGFVLEAGDAWVSVAGAHIDQVLMNLVVNARDACGATGQVFVRTTVADAAHARPGVVVLPPREGEVVALSVGDDGGGMDAATLASACEPFFSTKGPGNGTGMGLAIVHGIAQQMNAGLVISSSPGAGTLVTLLFPRVPAPAEKSPGALPPGAPPSIAGLRLLVIDDDATVRFALRRFLEHAGASVVEAVDGLDGLAKAREGGPLDVVVTDYLMPHMTGLELIERLRADGFTVPIVLSSGYLDDRGVLRDLPPDVRRLQKPIAIEALLAALAEITATG